MPCLLTRTLASSLLAAVALACLPARGEDSQLSALARERQFSRLEEVARERLDRLAPGAHDEAALWHLARLGAVDGPRRDALLPRAQVCVQELPQSALCHSALALLNSAAVFAQGLGARRAAVDEIARLFTRAVELDPRNFELRRDLGHFYLLTPVLYGGSVDKALRNARDFASIDPALAQVLRAQVHIYEKRWGQAEALLIGLELRALDAAAPPPDSPQPWREASREAWRALGFARFFDGDAAAAQRVFDRLLASEPDDAVACLGQGWALLEQRRVDPAISALERALRIDPAINAHYRLGLAYEARGETAKAASMLQEFLRYAPPGLAAADARRRLDELPG